MSWDESAEAQEWLAHVRRELVPKMQASGMTMHLMTASDPDPKFAVEVGYSILLGKPIILAVFPGAKVPDKLALIADEIVEVSNDELDGLQSSGLAAAVARVLGRTRRQP